VKTVPKYVFQTEQRAASKMVWSIKLFVCRRHHEHHAAYDLIARFSGGEDFINELREDLVNCVVEVPDDFVEKKSIKVRADNGKESDVRLSS